MTPTPRTDAAETMWNDIGMMVVLATFARHLERELADWQVLQASTQARLEQAERGLADSVSVCESLSKAADKLEKDKEYNARLCESLSAEIASERELADRLADALKISDALFHAMPRNISTQAHRRSAVKMATGQHPIDYVRSSLYAWKEARRE